MERETYRGIMIGVHIILAGIFLFSVIQSLFYDLCWIYPLFNLVVWMNVAISTVIGLRERE